MKTESTSLTPEQEFAKACNPLMSYLKDKHPHTTVIVTEQIAEMVEGVMAHTKRIEKDE